MASPEKLIVAEDNLKTSMGLSFPGERIVIRGKDLFTELTDMTWIELLLLQITGRNFSTNEIRLLESIWTLCTSYPEPRIWNNQVASLCGTTRSTSALALSAGTAVSEAKIYGGQPFLKCFHLLKRVNQSLNDGNELTDILLSELEHRPLPGYGRPIISKDERREPLSLLVEKLGFSSGPHYKLAFLIENELLDIAKRNQKDWPISMNFVAMTAGLLIDMGFTPFEYHQFLTLCFSAGMFPCFSEARQNEQGCFLPLRCDKLSYHGKTSRSW